MSPGGQLRMLHERGLSRVAAVLHSATGHVHRFGAVRPPVRLSSGGASTAVCGGRAIGTAVILSDAAAAARLSLSGRVAGGREQSVIDGAKVVRTARTGPAVMVFGAARRLRPAFVHRRRRRVHGGRGQRRRRR